MTPATKRKNKLKALYQDLNGLVSDAMAYYETAPELLSARLMRELQLSLAASSKLVEARADVVTAPELDKAFLLKCLEDQLKFEESFFLAERLPVSGDIEAIKAKLQPELDAYLQEERERMEQHIRDYEAAFMTGDLLPGPEENDAAFFLMNGGAI